METRVTLRPGDKGTKKMVERFGERLVCVRYRYDLARKMRYKTVELIIEEAAWDPARDRGDAPMPGKPPVMVGVKVHYAEEALRRDIKAAGGRWDAERKLWIVPMRVAKHLQLEARVVAVPDAPNSSPPQR